MDPRFKATRSNSDTKFLQLCSSVFPVIILLPGYLLAPITLPGLLLPPSVSFLRICLQFNSFLAQNLLSWLYLEAGEKVLS